MPDASPDYQYPATLLTDANDDGLLRLFGRHFVTMLVAFEGAHGDILHATYSAFVASHDGEWSFITAGHNIAQVRQLEKSMRLLTWDIADAFGGGSHKGTLIAGLKASDWKFIYSELDPSGKDIAATTIHPFIIRGLQANNVVALELADDITRLVAVTCHDLYLVGGASETTCIQGSRLQQNLYCIPVNPIPDEQVVPSLRGTQRRVHGVIKGDGWDSAGITTIAGTSGGPVFGFWLSPDRQRFDYAAVGVQSGWDPATKQIAAWPLGTLSARLAALKKANRSS